MAGFGLRAVGVGTRPGGEGENAVGRVPYAGSRKPRQRAAEGVDGKGAGDLASGWAATPRAAYAWILRAGSLVQRSIDAIFRVLAGPAVPFGDREGRIPAKESL